MFLVSGNRSKWLSDKLKGPIFHTLAKKNPHITLALGEELNFFTAPILKKLNLSNLLLKMQTAFNYMAS